MPEVLKISSARFPLPEAGKAGWRLTPRPGGWWIAERDGQRIRVVWVERAGKISFSLEGVLYQGEVLSASSSRSAPSALGAASDLSAQFPGKVRKVLVTEGAAVSEGDPLVLIEAMKMEFSIKAPFSGKVKAIRVREGQQLSPGDVLIDLENGR